MRLVLFLLLANPIIGFAQNGAVELRVKEKQNSINKNVWSYAWIYNTDTSYKKYSTITNKRGHFDSLPNGKYTVTIYSSYGTKVHKGLTIDDNFKKTYKLIFRPKPFIRYKDTIPLMTQLKSGDTLSISWTMNGCFSFDQSWYDIYKLDCNYFIRFSHKDTIVQRELKTIIADRIIRAEYNTLKGSPPISISTNRDYYTFHFNNEVYRFRDDGLGLQGTIKKEYKID